MKYIFILTSFFSITSFATDYSGIYKCDVVEGSQIKSAVIVQDNIDVGYMNPRLLESDMQHLYGTLNKNQVQFANFESNSTNYTMKDTLGLVYSLREKEIDLNAPAQFEYPSLKSVVRSENIWVKCRK